jgi:hypothetical protein
LFVYFVFICHFCFELNNFVQCSLWVLICCCFVSLCARLKFEPLNLNLKPLHLNLFFHDEFFHNEMNEKNEWFVHNFSKS